MKTILFIYKGTVGSILSHYIKPDPADLLADIPKPTDVILILVVSQYFEVDVFNAVKHISNAPVVWMCQDGNNNEVPASSVKKYIADDTHQWDLFNDILDTHVGPHFT
jgi:hypothetical protein